MNDFIQPRQDPRLRPYLKDVQDWHGYVRFLGLPTLQDHPDTPMHELFVPPLLSKIFISADSQINHWPQSAPVLATLREVRRLVVLGDPGSGKSTLINWLAWLLVSGVEERVPDWLQHCIPLPFVLREMELAQIASFDDLLESFLKRPVAARLKGQKDLLMELLSAGRVLVLADGLDEVSNQQRETLRNALWDGLDQYPESFFLATSRIIGYEDCPIDVKKTFNGDVTKLTITFDGQEFTIPGSDVNDLEIGEKYTEIRYILPFEDDRIRAFSVNWYRLRSLKPTADSDAEQFIKALFQDETTQRLARNPQLLTLMALIFRVRAHLPDGRALLYGLIAEAYLESIDKARHIGGSAADAAPWREKQRWLARVGFELQYRRTSAELRQDGTQHEESPAPPHGGERELLAQREEVVGWLAKAMEESGYAADPGFVESYLDWVARRSGLLLPRGEGQFAFVHLSFQEYFAALYLTEYLADVDWVLAQREENSEWEGDRRVSAAHLRSWAKDIRWQETLVFCFESFAHQPKDAKRLAGWLFGEDYQDFVSAHQPTEMPFETPEQAPRAELLARILTNPHTGLKANERERIFEALWQYWEKAERRFSAYLQNTNPKALSRILATEEWAKRFWQHLLALNPTELNLNKSAINDLSFVSGLTKLSGLSLEQTAISDLLPLADLTGLQLLILNQTPVSDLSPLAGLTGLLYLSLSQTSVSDLSPLAGLTGLQSLSLSQTSVSDLSPLAGLTGLQSLFLGQTPVNNLSPLTGLTGLQYLSLNQTPVSELSPLARLTDLQSLFLGQTLVNNLSPLTGLTGLQDLSLNYTPVSDLSPLLNLPKLETLFLGGVSAPIPPALRQHGGLEIYGP